MSIEEKAWEYECRPVLLCRKCGRELATHGHYVEHRKAGTVSFVVYNADKPCYWCKMEKEQEEEKK